jgi:hypothetical protein
VHRDQVAGPGIQAEHASGSAAGALEDLVTRARFAGHRVAELATDSAYTSQDGLKTTALIAPQPGSYSGMLPCLRFGVGARLVCSMSNAAMTFGRVSCGTMTSSTYPRSAAE